MIIIKVDNFIAFFNEINLPHKKTIYKYLFKISLIFFVLKEVGGLAMSRKWVCHYIFALACDCPNVTAIN